MKTKVINYRAGQHSRASVARRLQKVLISAGFLAEMLCFPVCKLATPAAFLDATPDSNELLKTMNIRNNGELWSGVITGTLPNGAKSIDVKFDDGDYKKAIIEGTRWKVFIPTGPEAAAGKQRWQVGSRHTLFLRARGANGNTNGTPLPVNFTRQINKDANGDGYADVVVGASANDGGTGASEKGTAYVFYGSVTGVATHALSATPYSCSDPGDCTEIQNPLHEANGSFGASVSFAGDLNGDGYADVVIGALNNDGGWGAADKGAVYVFYGSANGVISHPLSASTYPCNAPGDCTEIQNPLHEATGRFGTSVSFAGDVNGDGYADIVVGAYRNDGGAGASDKGAAYVFYGSATGITLHTLSATPYTCSSPNDCTEIQNPLNEADGRFGETVNFAGDVNGDSYADVVVSTTRNDGGTGALDKGVAYVFYGSGSGVTSHPLSATSYTCSGPGNCTEIQNPLHEDGGQFGNSVSFAGDMNADGYADIVVGATRNDGGTGVSDKGALYVFYGSATGITSHLLSASSYTCSGPTDCTEIQNPLHEDVAFFANGVNFAGDVNGDGYADVVVGAARNDGGTGAQDKGAAYIFYGSKTGVTSHPLSASQYACSGPGDCTEIQNPLHEANANFGNFVNVAGDVNGDGYADVVVGGFRNDDGTGALNKGAIYVFYGSATGLTSHTLSASPYTCSGPEDCTVIQNPLHEANGLFGNAVGTLAPTLRPAPASLDAPASPYSGVRRGWGWGQDALPARREDEVYA